MTDHVYYAKRDDRKIHVWTDGEEERELMLCRPCPCGCDERGGKKGVGYLTASDESGNGFTLWINDEDEFQALMLAFNAG